MWREALLSGHKPLAQEVGVPPLWPRHEGVPKEHLLFSAVLCLAGTMFLNTQVAAQILRIADLNTQQIRTLDLAKTVTLIPSDILEEHGPQEPC